MTADHAAALQVFDDTVLTLGEGPLWHPLRQQLLWFDILGQTLYARGDGAHHSWTFAEPASAAGWIDHETLLVATSTGLQRFSLATGAAEPVAAFAPGEGVPTRSNDGRADPWGGFWIGTMGLDGQTGAGAIWRYYRGELRLLYPGATIPNATCFDSDGDHALFTGLAQGVVHRVRLEGATGWPVGGPEPWLTVPAAWGAPDGAVIDQAGRLWLALWGGAAILCHDRQGRPLARLRLPVTQPTCPAFGGPGLESLYVTSATDGLDAQLRMTQPLAGQTLALPAEALAMAVGSSVRGRPEPAVVL